jgi:tetratricopeptide (TPR) repeat protein
MKYLPIALLLLISTQTYSQTKTCNECFAYFQKADYKASLQCFSEGDSTECFIYGKAYSYYKLFNYVESKKLIAHLLNKSNLVSNVIKGNAYFLLGRINSKEHKFKKELKNLLLAEKYIQTFELFTTTSYCYTQLKNYNKAIEYATRTIALSPSAGYAYNNRALAYIMKNELDKAKADIDKSMELDPANPYVYKHRGLMFLKLNNKESACMDFNTAITLGYREFGNESDKLEVDQLIEKNCK